MVAAHLMILISAGLNMASYNVPEALFSECFEPSQESDFVNWLIRTAAVTMTFSVVTGEFVTYALACWSMYQHDISMVNHLSNLALRRRHKKNATSLFGHIVYFSIEMFFLVIVCFGWDGIFSPSLQSTFSAMLLIMSENAILSVAMIALSDQLKKELKTLISSIIVMNSSHD